MDSGKEMLMTPNEIRKSLGLEPIKEPRMKTSSNNCPNCGAPITSWKCDYCDTVFEKDGLERARIQMEQLQTSKQIESIYKDAIEAIRNYRGIGL